MCDDDIHQGLTVDPSLSRRSFGLLTAGVVVGAATEASAATRVATKDVRIKTPDGIADAAIFYPEDRGSWPGVLIWPDVVSLRPVFREIGRRLAGAGYVVLVPNLYYRVRPAPVVEGAFDFSKPEDRAKLAPLRATVTPDGTARDALAYLGFLDGLPQTARDRKMGVQGYCMGGPLSFQTAAAAPERIGAVASFHGGGLAYDRPNSPHLLIPRTRAEYLVLVADNDDRQDPAAKDTLRAALAAAGRPGKVEVYRGAAHGWTVRGSQVYDETAAERAWSELLALYRRALA
jgi:carboxymethylenebutenolidase